MCVYICIHVYMYICVLKNARKQFVGTYIYIHMHNYIIKYGDGRRTRSSTACSRTRRPRDGEESHQRQAKLPL